MRGYIISRVATPLINAELLRQKLDKSDRLQSLANKIINLKEFSF